MSDKSFLWNRLTIDAILGSSRIKLSFLISEKLNSCLTNQLASKMFTLDNVFHIIIEISGENMFTYERKTLKRCPMRCTRKQSWLRIPDSPAHWYIFQSIQFIFLLFKSLFIPVEVAQLRAHYWGQDSLENLCK